MEHLDYTGQKKPGTKWSCHFLGGRSHTFFFSLSGEEGILLTETGEMAEVSVDDEESSDELPSIFLKF